MSNSTPGHIKSILQPRPQQATDRKVWSIGLGGVWLPFFRATNAAGETAISPEALGAPLRLAKEKDGTPRISSSGLPVMRVVKELSDQVRMVRDNFAAGLMVYAESILKAKPVEYKAQVEAAQKAGEPLVQKDQDDLDAYAALLAEEHAAVVAKAKADAEAAGVPETTGDNIHAPVQEPELVTA